MNIEKLITKSRDAVIATARQALTVGNPSAEPVHLPHGLLLTPDNTAGHLLTAAGADPAAVDARATEDISRQPSSTGSSVTQPTVSGALVRVLTTAETLAEQFGDQFVATEHLLIGLISAEFQVRTILTRAGATTEKLTKAFEEARGGKRVTSTESEGGESALDKYSIDLTERARSGKLDSVIGRDQEIRRVVQVLARHTKSNPVLIGEPGVDKTTVVKGLAMRLAEGDVPDSLKGRRLVSLDLTSMVVGAKYRGGFKERLKAVLSEIKESEGQIITFIGEPHTVVGAGPTSDSGMDAGNMLKPMFARGELRTIGTTTLDEYRERIEKDPALERRFQQVYIGEPSVEDAIAILRGLWERYEAHHKVRITDSALVATAALPNRYITSRELPDKAADLVNEATSRLRMEIDSSPEEIDMLRRDVDCVLMRELYLENEEDTASRECLAALRSKLADVQERLRGLEVCWEQEESGLNRVGDLKEKIDALYVEADKAQRTGGLGRASQLLHEEIPVVEQQLIDAEKTDADASRMVSDEVSEADIAEVVTAWTGIPVGRMLQGEFERLLHMEERLGERLIGQREAVKAVSDTMRRPRAGISDPSRPTGSFLFLGPTGIGKTKLTKLLADFLFDDETAIVRIDMSEYSEKHSAARLVGAPPGYVSYEEGGQLTEAVRRRPYSMISLDEVEKAHPDLFDILLQVLDDGRLTDGQGRTVDFRNTTLILTSNLGSQYLAGPLLSDGEKREQVMGVVRSVFRPEFLNRLDDIAMFESPTRDDLCRIIAIQLERLGRRLAPRRVTVEVTDAVADWLGEVDFDPVYGIRPLHRLIQITVEDRLICGLLSGQIHDGETVRFDRTDDGIALV